MVPIRLDSPTENPRTKKFIPIAVEVAIRQSCTHSSGVGSTQT